MKFDTDYIEQLAKIIADNELTEISLEDGNQAITIRKDLQEIIVLLVISLRKLLKKLIRLLNIYKRLKKIYYLVIRI